MSSKIHAAVDALELPLRVNVSPGQRGEAPLAADLLSGLRPGYVIADRAYDAEHVHDTILALGAVPVIPPRPGRRRAHRYDQLLSGYRGFVLLAAIMLWLR